MYRLIPKRTIQMREDDEVNLEFKIRIICLELCEEAEAKQKMERFKANFADMLKKYQIGNENAVMMYCDLMNLAEEMPEN